MIGKNPAGKTELKRSKPSLAEERFLYAHGYKAVAGIDEVGRGCIAGPVVAAAVILPGGDNIEDVFDGANDSKQLTALKRDRLYAVITGNALAYGVGIVDVALIDAINIYQATRTAMMLAIQKLNVMPDYVLLDAMRLPALQLPQKPIIKGDAISLTIACASIVAKVTRDRLMREYDGLYPGYNFARHKGYCTLEHLQALEELGPCDLHRKTFAPVKNKICMAQMALF